MSQTGVKSVPDRCKKCPKPRKDRKRKNPCISRLYGYFLRADFSSIGFYKNPYCVPGFSLPVKPGAARETDNPGRITRGKKAVPRVQNLLCTSTESNGTPVNFSGVPFDSEGSRAGVKRTETAPPLVILPGYPLMMCVY